MFGDQKGRGSPQRPDAGNDQRAVASLISAHALAHQRDACAQFPRQPNTRDKAERCLLAHRGNKAIGNIFQRIEQDGAEQHGKSAAFVPHDPPDNAPDQEAGHLRLK